MNSINWLAFIAERDVLCEVRTEFVLHNLDKFQSSQD
jgi:hypothetical protein